MTMQRKEIENRNWEEFHSATPESEHPWNHPAVDPDLAEFLKTCSPAGALDIGAGSGYQSLAMAEAGIAVTALDISPTAIKNAKARIAPSHPETKFVVSGILDFTPDEKFDLIVDRGCYHCLKIEERGMYARKIQSLLAENGSLFLKCFSDKEPPADIGPYRISHQILHDTFDEILKIVSIEDTLLPLNPECKHRDNPPKAYRVVIRK